LGVFRKGLARSAAALALLLVPINLAAATSGTDAVKSRTEHMKALGASAKSLGDQLRSSTPDASVVKAETAKIAAAAAALPTWFPRGSGPETGAKTRALPAIWTDAPGFAVARKSFLIEADKLDAAAATGNMAATGAQMKPLFGACKGCHDKYRGPES
jgi:cytochrome c556